MENVTFAGNGERRGAVSHFLTCIACFMVLFGLLMAGNALTVHAASSHTVSIDSALISGDDVVVTISASRVPSTDDGMYYIYANEVYEDGAEGELVAQVEAQTAVTVSFPLNFNTADSNFSRRFVVCVQQSGSMVQVSDEHYITNPESAATTAALRYYTGIKGLFIDPSRMDTGEAEDLGLNQIAYNIYIGDIVGESSDPVLYPTTYFEYDGVTYAFDTYMLSSYDNVFRYYTKAGMQITVNIINNLAADATDLIHPLALDGTECSCYAFNVTDEAGVKHLEAIAYFLGLRYNGTEEYGQVDNWVIGNEVNARSEQFYMSSTDLETNVSAYHKAFRIFYNGLRAGNATCIVYNSLDQQWGRLSNDGSFYSREYLDLFNEYVLREGNIDWGLSFHPYNSPLYDPYTWMGLSVWVSTDLSTPYMTMQNIFLLIDYMHQDEFLNPYGDVRSILISEIGFTSYFGDELQCASVVYAYLQASYYEDIDGFLMYRQTDNATEIESRIAQGLVDLDGNQKAAYDYYKYMGTEYEQLYKDLASVVIGCDIDDIIGSRDILLRTWQGYENGSLY